MQVLSPRALGQPPSPESLSVPGLQSRAITPESPQAPSRVADFHLTQIPGGLARGGWEHRGPYIVQLSVVKCSS